MPLLLDIPPELYRQLSPEQRKCTREFAFICLGVVVAVLIYHFIEDRYCKRNSPAALRAAATGRISDSLPILSSATADDLPGICRSIIRDLLALVRVAWHETTSVLAELPREERPVKALLEIQREAMFIQRRLRLARLYFFSGRRVDGHRLTLEAVERYVTGFTPMLQRIHARGPRWRQKIPLFEIRMPDADKDLTTDDTDYTDLTDCR